MVRILALTAVFACAATSAFGAPRVVSLDQCADQYVLALSDRAAIAGLSYRADDADSHLAERARGLPMRRIATESILAARPTVVVRYWGGDARLSAALARRNVTVVTIEDATDFEGIRANIRRVGAALDAHARGEALIADMDRRLANAKGGWAGRDALYLTPSGYTAGAGTLVDAILRAAGIQNAAPAGFSAVSLEETVRRPPRGFILGFFDQLSAAFERWGIGRHRALKRAMTGKTLASLPASTLSCPGWFAAEAAEDLAKAAPR